MDWTVGGDLFGGALPKPRVAVDQLVAGLAPKRQAGQPPRATASAATVNAAPSRNSRSKGGGRGEKASTSSGGDSARVPSMKRAMFDVQSFAIKFQEKGQEKEDDQKRLAISLGAKPAKGKYVNYKQLKEIRAQQKQSAKSDGASGIRLKAPKSQRKQKRQLKRRKVAK